METDGSLETCVFREVSKLYFIGLHQVFEHALQFLLPVFAKMFEQHSFHSSSILPDDRFKASSTTMPPQSAI